jgi:hypothetical protein
MQALADAFALFIHDVEATVFSEACASVERDKN